MSDPCLTRAAMSLQLGLCARPLAYRYFWFRLSLQYFPQLLKSFTILEGIENLDLLFPLRRGQLLHRVNTVFLVAIGLVGIPAEAIGAQFGKEDLETISLGSG
ncbi:MAG: hypothetical protein JRG77_10125 [Deltaproteobacteria bacterium]|nr:hypothetical protein [Deltaproteobacteria bacterium]